MADTANDYTFSPPPSFFKPFMEPASKAAPVAPYNTITATRSGHSFEMDDTPSVERIRLNHRSGTFIEMGPDGDEVHKVFGNGYEITVKDKSVYVSGNCNIYVDGDAYLESIETSSDAFEHALDRPAFDRSFYRQRQQS